MKYEWKQTIFKPEDFNGVGQYIVKEGLNKERSPDITDSGYLSTVMQKIGWTNAMRPFKNELSTKYFLIDMSDGLIHHGYYANTKNEDNSYKDSSEWEWHEFSGESTYEAKEKLCKYLNNNPNGTTYRFATHEEVVRVALYQKWRTKG